VQASSNDEAVAVIEQATFVRYPTLPKAWKYRFLSDFSALVGVDHLTFKRGSIVTRDGISPQLIEKLYARNAMLEPLPDMLAPLSD
jgi:hypothetical protein